jgi:MFS transporter, DHA2 family, methylenomycin A resistance protein
MGRGARVTGVSDVNVEAGNPRPRSSRLTVPVACIGFFVITLDATVVNMALPSISANLHGDIPGLQWVVDTYTLVFAAFMLSSGALSDRIGASRAFGIGLLVFTLASAFCGLAPTLTVLLAARALQGLAAAAMLPASLALVRQTLVDPVARAKGVALWAAGGGAAVAAGPVVGGALTSLLGWRAIFFINVPVGIAGIVGLAAVPRSAPRPAPFDVSGQLTSVLALTGLTFSVIEGGRKGFTSLPVLIALLVFAASAVAFLAIETRSAHPSVPLDQFRSPTVVACTATGFALNFAYFGVVFVLSLFYQHERGDSPFMAGLMFVPMTILIMATNIMAGRLTNRFGPGLPMVVGQLVEAGGFLAVLLVGPHAPTYAQLIALVPVGLGAGTATPPMMTALLEAVDPARAGLASGFLNSARQVGSALGVAMFGAMISDATHFDRGMRLTLVIAVACLVATAIASYAFVRPASTRAAAKGGWVRMIDKVGRRRFGG